VAPHPFGLTLSPDGSTIITANSGVGPFSISIIRNYNTANPVVKQIPEGLHAEKGLLEAVFMGLAISPDNGKVYVAGGQQNRIYIFDLNSGKKLGEINCDAVDGAIVHGARRYALDFRVALWTGEEPGPEWRPDLLNSVLHQPLDIRLSRVGHPIPTSIQ